MGADTRYRLMYIIQVVESRIPMVGGTDAGPMTGCWCEVNSGMKYETTSISY